jgi:sorbitol-specific phosphotransferase system component IIA
MVTVRINDKARSSKKLIEHVHSLKFVEFEENGHVRNDFDALEEQSITGDVVCVKKIIKN